MIRRTICFFLALIWMVIIFAFSAQPSDESTQTSLAVGTMICRIIVPGYENLPLEEQRQMADNIEFPVRKTAHATEYALLSILFFGALVKDAKAKKKTGLLAIGFTTIYAISDEIHQWFIPGRNCHIRDVLIDTAGAVLGIAIIWLILYLNQWLKNRSKKDR